MFEKNSDQTKQNITKRKSCSYTTIDNSSGTTEDKAMSIDDLI